MFFLFIMLIIILIILTIRIKIQFLNFYFNSQSNKHLKDNYEIKLIIYTFFKLPIFKIRINSGKIQNIINNEKVKFVIKKQELKIVENKKDIDKYLIKQLKNIRIDIKEMNLKILIGTEDASITAFIIPIVSTVLAIILSKSTQKYNDKQIFSITPIYVNQNLINIEFSGIFQIEMIHIINTIFRVKRKKGDKNERTSNRRSYDYGYE